MTESQLNAKLDVIERMIAKERNTSTLKTLNNCYQKLINKLVEMDLKNDAVRK